jgi:hemoglobin
LAVLLVGLIGVGGCANKKPAGPDMRPLYERLGGEPAIQAVVDDFVFRASNNIDVNFTRKGTGKEWAATPANMERLRKMLVQYIAEKTGGPVTYQGKDMVSAHAGYKITNAEFDAAMGDLRASLNKNKVPQREQDELLAIVETTRRQMVEVR